VRAHIGLETVGIVSGHMSLEVECTNKRSWAAGTLVLLSSISQGLRLHRNVRLAGDARNGAELAFTLGRAIAALGAI